MAKDVEPKDPMLSALDRLAAIAEAQQAQANAQAIVSEATAKRLKPKSLEIGDTAQISAFNLRGEKDFPLPRLKFPIHAPWKLDPNSHSLDREEVELCNLLEPGEFLFELNDGAIGKMTVTGTRNDATGAIEELHLKPTPAWDRENKGRFLPLRDMLRAMVGAKAETVMTRKQEKSLIARGELAVSVQG